MDYTGKSVFHKAKYGEVTIVSSDSNGYIFVKDESEDSPKNYATPECLKKYLEALQYSKKLEEVKSRYTDNALSISKTIVENEEKQLKALLKYKKLYDRHRLYILISQNTQTLQQ